MKRLPDCLTHISPVGETLTAALGGVESLETATDIENARLHVSTADGAGLALWEADYGLPPDGDTETRRRRVLAALRGRETATPALLRSLCVRVGGADRGELTEDFGSYAATLTAVGEGRVPEGDAALCAAAGRICPAHLKVSVIPCMELKAEKTLFTAPYGAIYAETIAGAVI
jgi:hypothetical protein